MCCRPLFKPLRDKNNSKENKDPFRVLISTVIVTRSLFPSGSLRSSDGFQPSAASNVLTNTITCFSHIFRFLSGSRILVRCFLLSPSRLVCAAGHRFICSLCCHIRLPKPSRLPFAVILPAMVALLDFLGAGMGSCLALLCSSRPSKPAGGLTGCGIFLGTRSSLPLFHRRRVVVVPVLLLAIVLLLLQLVGLMGVDRFPIQLVDYVLQIFVDRSLLRHAVLLLCGQLVTRFNAWAHSWI